MGRNREIKMSDHDNLKQKLFEALHDLFSEKGLPMGLTYASMYLDQVREVPSEFKTEFEAIKADLPTAPSGTEVSYEPREIAPVEAVVLARRILSLYTAVMGGL
jgi:hypothetical protein